jgi:hypothetical protein
MCGEKGESPCPPSKWQSLPWLHLHRSMPAWLSRASIRAPEHVGPRRTLARLNSSLLHPHIRSTPTPMHPPASPTVGVAPTHHAQGGLVASLPPNGGQPVEVHTDQALGCVRFTADCAFRPHPLVHQNPRRDHRCYGVHRRHLEAMGVPYEVVRDADASTRTVQHRQSRPCGTFANLSQPSEGVSPSGWPDCRLVT